MKELDNLSNGIKNIKNLAEEGNGIENIRKQAQTSSVAHSNMSASNRLSYQDKWKAWYGKCPKCGKTDTEYDSSMVLTSYPPKYKCRCNSCENVWYDTNPFEFPQRIDPLVPNNGRTGWICPKCGRGISPDLNVCPFCNRDNIVYCNTTNTLEQPSTYAYVTNNTSEVNTNGLC